MGLADPDQRQRGTPGPVSGAHGQASVEMVGAVVALAVGALALFQVLAAGRTAVVADGAAQAAAMALVNGRDPAEAARAATPGWPGRRVHVREHAGRVRVTLDSPAALRSLRAPLRVSAEAVVRRPRE